MSQCQRTQNEESIIPAFGVTKGVRDGRTPTGVSDYGDQEAVRNGILTIHDVLQDKVSQAAS